MESRDTKLNQVRNDIRIARYDVDPVAVADAIVRRRWSLAVGAHGSRYGSTGRRGRTSVTCIARRGSQIQLAA